MKCDNCGSWVSGDSCKNCETTQVSKPKKSTGIKARSSKKEEQDKVYNDLRKVFLKENPRCAVFPSKLSTDVHHKKGRLGNNYLDVSTWLAVSRDAHRKIEDNPEWAYKMGYSELRLKNYNQED
jgi:hypothetical protein